MTLPSRVPPLRVQAANDAPVRGDGELVLYWMIAARRTGWSFALERATEWARELRLPLVVLEALRCDYRWASDRLHRFVVDGMADNAARLARHGALYHPYVEPRVGAGRGLVAALAARAAVVVTDDFPCFFLPRMVVAAARQCAVRLEAVDGNGLLPLRASGHAFERAVDLRRFLQRELPAHLDAMPRADPLAGADLPRLAELPAEIRRRWPATELGDLAGAPLLAGLPIDHEVAPVALRGGERAARRRLRRFVESGLASYGALRERPLAETSSGLSPYLHFGHLAAHEVFTVVAARENWNLSRLGVETRGRREGWWGMSAPAEAFLDQLVTWRELGFNGCCHRADYDRYESLPAWARATLERHAADPRPWTYSLADLAAARTHDRLWNAAQRQLRGEGVIHNYLRMLWGKKILEWSPTPRAALATMIELNDRWALDGRDPNSYSGISWCLGRYDRPWPERQIFGTVRSMSSASTLRKLDLGDYLARWGEAEATLPLVPGG
ncbi:MAG: deoxyribodipyrimidine photolyase [Acidobacteriota bacterium]